MLMELLTWHLSILMATFSATFTLIVFRQNWGPLPHFYVRCVEYLQDSLLINKQLGLDANNNEEPLIVKHHLMAELAEHAPLNIEESMPFEVVNLLMVNGIEAIVQDDISRGFQWNPQQRWTILDRPPVPLSMDTVHFYVLYGIGLYFRFTFLLPLRISIMVSSIVFLCVMGTVAVVGDLSREKCLYLSTTFCRLFSAGTGLVANYGLRENKPTAGSGICVSNHLSANDIQSIHSDVRPGECGYTVTGQKHGGIIYPIEVFSAKISPTLWMDRSKAHERKDFQQKIMDYSVEPDKYPVLLFPEGFCSNNDVVLQFRKAVFTGGAPIHPIAIKQNARFGDAFWKEDTFLPYLLRLMSSFACVMDIDYLPVMHMRDGEDDSQFAKRVQTAIAEHIGKDAISFDGGLKRKKDQQRFREKVSEVIAQKFFA